MTSETLLERINRLDTSIKKLIYRDERKQSKLEYAEHQIEELEYRLKRHESLEDKK